jgi:hypothetical protein
MWGFGLRVYLSDSLHEFGYPCWMDVAGERVQHTAAAPLGLSLTSSRV